MLTVSFSLCDSLELSFQRILMYIWDLSSKVSLICFISLFSCDSRLEYTIKLIPPPWYRGDVDENFSRAKQDKK